MNEDVVKQLQKIADTVRSLSMEAVQKAGSGHPGLPMGCAELGAFLFARVLRYNPKDPNWMNRDRLVLSAGHGSMWLYSLLHLSGYDLSLEEIKNFRQLGSLTPGHPEFLDTPGVEVTTGPLGQGVGNAVGIALGIKLLAAQFNTEDIPLLDAKVYCLAGDGCMMEGISSEVSSFAGHLQLDNLVLIYDDNNICLDGPTSECFSEDTKARYRAYGWHVVEVDPYDFQEMEKAFQSIQQNQKKPTLVVAHTIIGKGSPNKAGTHKAHGAPLGEEEVALTKKALGLPEEPFYVPQSVVAFFEEKKEKAQKQQEEWEDLLRRWSKASPEKWEQWEKMKNKVLPADLEEELHKLPMKSPLAGRTASNLVLQYIAKQMPQIYGGSADLSCSDMTMMKELPIITAKNFSGRNIKYGVREFGMATIVNGLFRTDMITPFCGTFLTFSDYMRNAIRLAALSHYAVVYQFTHDSIFLGEDGPTHQPVEHLAALRAIPNLQVIRPADNHEVKMAWIAALKHQGPTAIILSRQNLLELEETKISYAEGLGRGAYILKLEKKSPDFTLIATGSEVGLTLEVAASLQKMGKQVRVISFPCWELFERQPDEYKKRVLGGDLGQRVSIEAASDFGWAKYVGPEGICISVEGFGKSAPMQDLQQEFGFTVDSILERLMAQYE